MTNKQTRIQLIANAAIFIHASGMSINDARDELDESFTDDEFMIAERVADRLVDRIIDATMLEVNALTKHRCPKCGKGELETGTCLPPLTPTVLHIIECDTCTFSIEYEEQYQ